MKMYHIILGKMFTEKKVSEEGVRSTRKVERGGVRSTKNVERGSAAPERLRNTGLDEKWLCVTQDLIGDKVLVNKNFRGTDHVVLI
jgi:hypothetical protein